MNVIVIDSESEYDELTSNLEGDYIDLTSGQYLINVLEPKRWTDEVLLEDFHDEEVSKERVKDLLFITSHEEQWRSAFVASEAMYIMTVEAAEAYIEYVNKLDQQILAEKHYTFTALMHLHGRALQQFLEIITLMKKGFVDGAYARWRSMYELAIISSFISEHGEPVAKEFIELS